MVLSSSLDTANNATYLNRIIDTHVSAICIASLNTFYGISIFNDFSLEFPKKKIFCRTFYNAFDIRFGHFQLDRHTLLSVQ